MFFVLQRFDFNYEIWKFRHLGDTQDQQIISELRVPQSGESYFVTEEF